METASTEDATHILAWEGGRRDGAWVLYPLHGYGAAEKLLHEARGCPAGKLADAVAGITGIPAELEAFRSPGPLKSVLRRAQGYQAGPAYYVRTAPAGAEAPGRG